MLRVLLVSDEWIVGIPRIQLVGGTGCWCIVDMRADSIEFIRGSVIVPPHLIRWRNKIRVVVSRLRLKRCEENTVILVDFYIFNLKSKSELCLVVGDINFKGFLYGDLQRMSNRLKIMKIVTVAL